MQTRNLRDLVRFSPEGPVHRPLFETDRLWSELVCLDRNQTVGPITDPESDALLTVVAGEAVVFVGTRRRRVGQWETVLVPARSELTVRNASADPAVLLLVAAPPPVPRPVSG
ncbi:MAG TPA: cupin domain-containing protein [Actinomycetota bacterium]|nr:cupin domain-containing protein [Actinomycetota bacterium]